jgi:GDP-4-dehydro-6-deoxy-D-mannose reductase
VRTVLVTGAEGFCGRHVAERLRAEGCEVVAGVRNRARKLAHERQGRRAFVCDVTDPITVARVVAATNPDALIHLAGVPFDAVSGAPLEAHRVIVSAWANLLDAVRRSTPRAKVVLASCVHVYGEPTGDRPLSETDPPHPTTLFGAYLHAAEQTAQAFVREYRMDVTIARAFDVVGPGQPAGSYWGALAQRLSSWHDGTHGREWWLPGLSAQRDICHVEDAAAAYAALMTSGGAGEIYNICSGQVLERREAVTQLAAHLGVHVELRDLPGDSGPAVLRGDNGRLRSVGWTPTRSAADAIRDLADSYKRAAEPVHA